MTVEKVTLHGTICRILVISGILFQIHRDCQLDLITFMSFMSVKLRQQGNLYEI